MKTKQIVLIVAGFVLLLIAGSVVFKLFARKSVPEIEDTPLGTHAGVWAQIPE